VTVWLESNGYGAVGKSDEKADVKREDKKGILVTGVP
jgi:hypothetical protein